MLITIKETLGYLDKRGLYPPFHEIEKGVNEPICIINGERYLQFCSNNYLSLANNNKVIKAGIKALKKFGMGPGGSRVISGNISIINELEDQIADITNTQSCITFPTGYMANITVFQALMDSFLPNIFSPESGVIFSDEYNHGSIIDGCRLATVQKVIFEHNNFDDLIAKINNNNKPNKLIVTEGVFSLEGEIINLPKLIEIKKKKNALLMIDDAHGFGLFGKRGGGVGELFQCSKDVDILMGCLDKATGGTGGFLCGSNEMIRYLRIASRSSLLSSALPTVMAGAMIESINQITSKCQLRENIIKKSKYLRERLSILGFTILGNDILPAIPVLIGSEEMAVEFSRQLLLRKIYIAEIRWPAVPLGKARYRIIVMVNHTYDQMDNLIDAFKEIGKELKII